jgi:hypothetical protein
VASGRCSGKHSDKHLSGIPVEWNADPILGIDVIGLVGDELGKECRALRTFLRLNECAVWYR